MSHFIFRIRKKFKRYLQNRSGKSYLAAFLKIFFKTIQSFINLKGFEKASTMTFYTLLSIVPLLAIGFGIAQYFGFEKEFSNIIYDEFYHQPEIADKMIQFSLSTLKQTRGDIIASVGIVVLIWTVLNMLGNIESYFNEFWHVKKPRSFVNQLKCFIPLILMFPLFFIGTSSILVFLSNQSNLYASNFSLSSNFEYFLTIFFKGLQFLISWAWLSFLFIYLPNTKVALKVGIQTGFIAALFFLLWQWIYLFFQVNATSYGTIYGSFAAIPLFLFWLNYNWLILFLSAGLAYQLHLRNK